MARSSSILLDARPLAVVLALALGGCDGVDLFLSVVPGIDPGTQQPYDTSAVSSLHVIADNGVKLEERDVALDQQTTFALADLDTTLPLGFEVWGCESLATCVRDKVLFRGCTPTKTDYSQRPTGPEHLQDNTVAIELVPFGDPTLDQCPAF